MVSLKQIRYLSIYVSLLVLTAVGSFKLGQGELRGGPLVGEKIDSSKLESQVDLRLFWEVWRRLESTYLEKAALDVEKMVYGAISGLTGALDDPYTSFLPPQENVRSKEDLSGEFDGVGIQLGYVNKTLAVMSPLPNNPAIKAGLKAGDLILRIRDEGKKVDRDTVGISLNEAVNLIRGKKGQAVTLTVFSEGDREPREVRLVRDTILVPSVELEFTKSDRVAWLKVIKFGEKTAAEWDAAVIRILKEQPEGIVLDLRNNPGGYLQRAVDLASEFVADGMIVSQQGRDETETFSVNRKGRLIGKKMVVLVNKGSASASEILAGALRERLGVKLVGEKTFGKGTVQEAQELSGGAGLHITIAKWLLPSGKNIHQDGLSPDVEVKQEIKEDDPSFDNQLE
ncbi:S41 family peptidase, partial [Candidatus Collierbacteria bacterium]|nr:S41 family peptidase [Candidatus Collierbacteria bacterium]